MLPMIAFSANKFVPNRALAGVDNTVVIPLDIANDDGVMAIDIPLQFSEGVTLKEVTFENTRVEHFDLKISKIDNDNRTVLIGLIHQMSAQPKATLDAGEGPIANLVFQIDDPTVSEISLDVAKMESPSHDLVFIYNTRSNPDQIAFDQVEPKFDGVRVALSGAFEDALPTSFALAQNYPNPFNPSTEIPFSLPVNSEVQLDIFNVLGQKVTTLVAGEMPAGEHVVTWDGTSDDGSSVSSGVYFYRISASDFHETRKMMMLK
jgi:methionine-rich copper-binding protein CopC